MAGRIAIPDNLVRNEARGIASHLRQLLGYFPGLDYNNPASNIDRKRLWFGHPDNVTGYQQRVHQFHWAIRMTTLEHAGEIGLDLGSAGVATPYCVGVDLGGYKTNGKVLEGRGEVIWDLRKLEIFREGAYSVVLANHVVEHIDAQIVEWFREGPIRLLRPGGIFAWIVPDQRYNDVLAMDVEPPFPHKWAWTPKTWMERVGRFLEDLVTIEELDTLANGFSFDCVLRKKKPCAC